MAKKLKAENKNKDEFNRIKNKVEYAMQFTESANKKRGFERFEDYFRGNYAEYLDVTIPVTEVNEVYAAVKTWLASLYIRDPNFAANPMKNEETVKAVVQEQVLNNDWKKLRVKREIKKCIEEASIVGRSWIGTGYNAKFAKIEDMKEELNEFIEEESIWVKHISYKNIIYDFEAIDPPYDCAWLDHWYYKSTEILKKKYGIDKIMPSKNITDKNDKIMLCEEDNNRTIVHNYWDKNTGKLYIFCDGYDDFLEIKEPAARDSIGPYKIKGFPYKMLKFEDRTGKKDNFPLSLVEIFEPQVKEKIKIRSMALNHLKKGGRQIFIKKQSMENTEKDKFELGIDGAIIECNDIPANIIYSPTLGQLPADMYAIENRVDMDRDKISGQSAGDQGGTTQTKSRTLGEQQSIQASTLNRNQEKSDIIEDFCEEIAYAMIGLERQFYTAERLTRVVGDIDPAFLEQLAQEGKYDGVSIKFTNEDIRCEAELDVKVGSTLPLNKSNRMKVATEVLKLGPALGLTPNSYASIAAGKQIFHDLEWPEVEKAYDMDLQAKAQAPKENPMDKMRLIKSMQDIKRGAKDMELKETRIVSNQLGNMKKGLENVTDMKEASSGKEPKGEV